MKNILLPTDFSENAWNAAKYAIELYKDEECVFHLLNTYTPTIAHSRFMAVSMDGGQAEDAVRRGSENGLRQTLEQIDKAYDFPNHTFKTTSSFNLLVDEIKRTIEEENIDMIVIGAKGTSELDEVFMGNNTVRIIKSINNCPVLAVPRYFEYNTLSEIAFATDFQRFYTESELRPMIDLANTFNAIIRVVHVQYEIASLTEIQQFNLNMLQKYLNGTKHYVHTISEINSISKTLETFIGQLGIHLVAMLNYRHSYMERLTREPVVSRMVFHSNTPLLIIPELGMTPFPRSKKNKKGRPSQQR